MHDIIKDNAPSTLIGWGGSLGVKEIPLLNQQFAILSVFLFYTRVTDKPIHV